MLKSTFEIVRTDRRRLKAYTRDLFAPESMICALGKKRKRAGRFKIHTSACTGDSGAPLVADTGEGAGRAGTVSFGGALMARRKLLGLLASLLRTDSSTPPTAGTIALAPRVSSRASDVSSFGRRQSPGTVFSIRSSTRSPSMSSVAI